jgi:hypothetical protein
LYERFLCWMLPANEVYFELEPAPPAALGARAAAERGTGEGGATASRAPA